MPESSEQLSVLIVDDDSGMRSSLRRILKLDGYGVDEADSVAAATDRDNWQDYFAILLDRKMPDGTADDLLPQIRRVAPHAAVMIITGNADLESSIAAIRQGAADYLLKPIEPESLRARLRGLARLRNAQLELSKRDAQLSFMVEHLPAAAAYIDIHSGEVRFNQVIEDITGYTRQEMSTKDQCFEKLFGDQASAVRDRYERNLKSWIDAPRRLHIRRKDGVDRVIEFRGYRYDDHEVWLLDDITDRDRYETELKIRDQAIQAANEGVVIADATQPNHPIIFVNKAFEALSGLTMQEALGQGCDLFCTGSPDDRAATKLREAVANEQEYRDTVKCVRSDGTHFWNRISLAPVRTANGSVSHIVAVMEDVTERRNAQDQLLQSERLAAIGQMVTGLAHESRNALQRAQACLDMLSLDLERQPEQLELTDKIRRAMDDLHRHYEEVRNYAAPINLEQHPTDVVKLLRDTWRNLEPVRGSRKFELIEDSTDTNTICKIDAHRIDQVFRNVIENSLAACSDPGRLTVSCTAVEEAEQACLRISFRDNGPGFNAETTEKVFQPFFTTKQKGTGLGMAICKRIIEAHGGRIEIAAGAGSGAEVIILLPR